IEEIHALRIGTDSRIENRRPPTTLAGNSPASARSNRFGSSGDSRRAPSGLLRNSVGRSGFLYSRLTGNSKDHPARHVVSRAGIGSRHLSLNLPRTPCVPLTLQPCIVPKRTN